MNDQELKNLLNKDKSTPSRPMNEWSSIEARIQNESESGLSILKNKTYLGLITASLVLVVALPNLLNHQSVKSIDEDNIASYLLEDDYLMDSANTYAWIDSDI